jgi:hypothetical protein
MNPGFFSSTAPYDVASNIGQALPFFAVVCGGEDSQFALWRSARLTLLT